MKNSIEALVGLVVLIITAVFLNFAYKGANLNNNKNNYRLLAKFTQIDGLAVGGDVRISGVKIGTVIKQYLDTANFRAVVEFSISNNIKLPKDSSAQIVSDGLLGGKYLSISAGADDSILTNGDEIKFTQSSISIESLISKMVFSNNGDANGKQQLTK